MPHPEGNGGAGRPKALIGSPNGETRHVRTNSWVGSRMQSITLSLLRVGHLTFENWNLFPSSNSLVIMEARITP
jgi:hypothetical protein